MGASESVPRKPHQVTLPPLPPLLLSGGNLFPFSIRAIDLVFVVSLISFVADRWDHHRLREDRGRRSPSGAHQVPQYRKSALSPGLLLLFFLFRFLTFLRSIDLFYCRCCWQATPLLNSLPPSEISISDILVRKPSSSSSIQGEPFLCLKCST